MKSFDGVRKDMFGRVIKLGDWMVYPATVGRSGGLMIVQVVEFVEPTADGYGFTRGEPGRMKVRAIAQAWGKVEARGKLSLLNFPERGMIVPRDALPDEAVEGVHSVPDKRGAA